MPRIALVSDIHGNALAFEAVIQELEREPFDEVICLGDVAEYGPQPANVVDRLRQLGWRCILGNMDAFLVRIGHGEVTEGETEAERLDRGRWSTKQLGADRLNFIGSFEPRIELNLDGLRLVCCHSTPTSNSAVLLPDAPWEALAAAIDDADLVVSGHVHLQWSRRVGKTLWVSVGSVGLAYEQKEPRDAQPFEPWAEYTVLTIAAGRIGVEFRRIPFDVHGLIRSIRASDMPDGPRAASLWKGS